MKIIKYTLGISLGLMCLLFLEGMMTLGSAFNFETYTEISWLAQILAIVITICLSIVLTEKSL